MRAKIFAGAATALAALSLGTMPVGAGQNGGGSGTALQCNTTVNGGTFSSVQVPAGAVCVLNGVSVSGGATVGANAYLESNSSSFGSNVLGDSALTIYLHRNSIIGSGSLAAGRTAQVFVYDSSVHGSLGSASSVAPGYGHFQVCNSTVTGDTGVAGFGPDILIGDPAAGCGANTLNGSLHLYSNSDDQELYVIGNSIRGDVTVSNNTGVGDKRVNGNSIHGSLSCSGNSAPFDGSGNGQPDSGQCS